MFVALFSHRRPNVFIVPSISTSTRLLLFPSPPHDGCKKCLSVSRCEPNGGSEMIENQPPKNNLDPLFAMDSLPGFGKIMECNDELSSYAVK